MPAISKPARAAARAALEVDAAAVSDSVLPVGRCIAVLASGNFGWRTVDGTPVRAQHAAPAGGCASPNDHGSIAGP
jgi:hypothetical protein